MNNITQTTEQYLLDTVGVKIPFSKVAAIVGLKPSTARNQASSGAFPIKTYMDCNRRYADFRDVAAYLDKQRESAK
jgi:hypothetical protein